MKVVKMGTEVNMIKKMQVWSQGDEDKQMIKEMKININICEEELTQLVIDCTGREGKGQNQG